MNQTGAPNLPRFMIPQVLTASRFILGMFAIYWAAQRQFDLAAKILVLGFVTDVLDGALARKLGVTCEFGLLFDFFADYLYYVVAPTCLVLFLVGGKAGLLSLLLLSLPTLGGAVRYAKRAALKEAVYCRIRASAGLPTNVCAFYMLTFVFLWQERILDTDSLRQILTVTLPLLAVLMPGPRRYPWLTDYLWILIPMAVGLYTMPFLYTGILASITLGVIVIYVLFSPMLIPQHTADAAAPAGQTPTSRAGAH
jgi:CDP-diacylglycerol--serine O-phosphatidyltransferase